MAKNKQKKPSADERRQWIATTAYFMAQNDGFKADPDEYWHAAEKEINDIVKDVKKQK